MEVILSQILLVWFTVTVFSIIITSLFYLLRDYTISR